MHHGESNTTRTKLIARIALVTLLSALLWSAQPASADELGPAGGNGGTPESSKCNDNLVPDMVMVGIRVRAGSWLDRVYGLCARYDNGVRGQVLGAVGKIGGDGGQPFELFCPTNKALIGMKGRSSWYIDSLAIACASLNRDGSIKPGTTTWTSARGGTGGASFGPLLCRDYPVNTLNGRGDSWVDRLSMLC